MKFNKNTQCFENKYENGNFCSFGITESIAAAFVAAGLDASVAAVIAPAVVGSLSGGALGEITGGGKGLTKGLELGALSGGGIGLGGELGGALGGAAGSAIGDVAGGALGGGIGSSVTGGKFGTGALEGAASGGLSAAVGSLTNGAPASTPAAGGGVSGAGAGAAGSAAPSGIGDLNITSTPAQVDASTGASSPVSTGGSTPGATAPDIASQIEGTPSGGGASASQLASGTPDIASAVGSVGSSGLTSTLPGTPSVSPSGGNFSNAASSISNGDFKVSPGTSQGFTASGDSTFPLSDNAASVSLSGAPAPDATSNISGGGKGGIAGAFKDFSAGNYGSALGDIAPSLVSAAGLGADIIKGNQAVKGENNIKSIAAQEQQQGQILQNYLATGTLPAGLQSAVDQATASAQAAIRSRYAAQGQSGSSAEQEELSAVQSNASATAAQMAEQLLSTGISETGMAANLYTAIMNNSLTQDAQLGSAIGNFSTALAGGNPGININSLLQRTQSG